MLAPSHVPIGAEEITQHVTARERKFKMQRIQTAHECDVCVEHCALRIVDRRS
jgi:hypothetical protein